MPSTQLELEVKIKALRALLDRHGAEAILLRRVSSFAWATCGAASYINSATTEGTASLLIRGDRLTLITTNIEAPRLEEEEKLAAQGWEFKISPWHTPMASLEELTSGLRLAADVPYPGAKDIHAEIARLRCQLTPEEGERFRELGHGCAEAMSATAGAIGPGMSEHAIAGRLDLETRQRGIQPIVNLIATDERILRHRHPLPTGKTLDRYAMLVLCGRRAGLVCSITRLVHFGPVPEDLQRRILATARVNATLIAQTRPGRSLGEVFAQGQRAYAEAGFVEEWRHHHQGGAAGYEPREILATPGSMEIITEGQVYAWNPSIRGAKMEDSILVGKDTNEILTPTPLWPVVSIENPEQPGTVPCALALEL